MKWKAVCVSAACAATLLAQTPPETILTIETANTVFYRGDTADPVRYATSAAPVSQGPLTNFRWDVWLSDIVAVNGKPAKGALVTSVVLTFLRPQPTGNQGIADVNRNTIIRDSCGDPAGRRNACRQPCPERTRRG